jgi:Alginate lyase
MERTLGSRRRDRPHTRLAIKYTSTVLLLVCALFVSTSLLIQNLNKTALQSTTSVLSQAELQDEASVAEIQASAGNTTNNLATPTNESSPVPSISPSPSSSPTPAPITTSPSVQPTVQVTSTPAKKPTVTASPQPVVQQSFDLTNWKITLPTGTSGSPTEVKQPELARFMVSPWFLKSASELRFRAPVNGVTTSGSSYPRSELREMTNNGSTNASWSSTAGTHTMIITQAITAVPQGKKHVVAGQIHDSGDDVIVIRLEDKKLFVDINGTDGPVLDSNYSLGRKFTVKFFVTGGTTKIYYNNSATPAHTLNKSYSGAYFKAGAYTQSNCSTEGSKGGACTDTNYGEVVIYSLNVTHQ